jgi:manganese/zinc/iron transport system permease protein
LLRGIYELLEAETPRDRTPTRKQLIEFNALMRVRSWSESQLRRQIRLAIEDELVVQRNGDVRLTERGFAEAARLTRQHRLWELYLIHYADVATARVDRDADDIEHVLESDVVDELERLLHEDPMQIPVPVSPHEIEGHDHTGAAP